MILQGLGLARIGARGIWPPNKKIQREGRWTPPLDGIPKINTDGTSRGNLGYVGVGGVGRDSFEVVLFFFSIYQGHQNNNLMEAPTILIALEKVCSLGWHRVICKSNSQLVINWLNKHILDRET